VLDSVLSLRQQFSFGGRQILVASKIRISTLGISPEILNVLQTTSARSFAELEELGLWWSPVIGCLWKLCLCAGGLVTLGLAAAQLAQMGLTVALIWIEQWTWPVHWAFDQCA